MPVTRQFNNKNFPIPVNGDRNWGKAVSDFLIEVANAALSKAGGNFTLTADVNFGANFGVVSKYLKSASANIAQSGVIRLANNEGLAWRNFANDADLVVKINDSNQFEVNGSPLASDADVAALSGRMDNAEDDIGDLRTDVDANTSAIALKLNATAGTASQVRIDDYIDFDEEVDPSSPSAGKTRVWIDSDGKAWKKRSTGPKSELGGGGLKPVAIKTSSGTTASGTSEPVDPSGGAVTRTLTSISQDDAFEIFDVSGQCSPTNYIRITPGGSDKILYKGIASTDSLVIRRPYGVVKGSKEAGSDTWKVEFQTAAIANDATPFVPGKVRKSRWQQKLYSGTTSTAGILLTMNNLEIGKFYRVIIQGQTNSAAASIFAAVHGANQIARASVFASGGHVGSASTVFQATTTTVTLNLIQGDANGDGSRARTWISLEELADYDSTTDWT